MPMPKHLTQPQPITQPATYVFANDGRMPLCRGSKAEHDDALDNIANAAKPATDPVFGAEGPLVALWRA